MTLSPEELEKKIRDARGKADQSSRSGKKGGIGDGGALGMAMRAAIEMVSALVVGGGLGYFIDKGLGTKPWGMIIMFFLGSIAGFLNIYRAQVGQDFKIGFKETPQDTEEKDKKSDEDHLA